MKARKRPRDKGSRGEREVVDIFRRHGYEGTMRAPGSGALRSYGAGDLSPFPGDLLVKRTQVDRPLKLIVEVKYDERVEAGGLRTLPGSTFLKATLRDLGKLTDQHNERTIGGGYKWPLLVARANLHPWRFFLREFDFLDTLHADPLRGFGLFGWVEIPEDLLFEIFMERIGDG
jgi:hypothetical protein